MSDIDPIQTARELATHAADIEHLQADVDKIVNDMEDIKKALNEIQKTLSEAKGGWKMLLLIGGAAGTFGAALTQIAHWVWGK
jgi:prefoldin subunit 5